MFRSSASCAAPPTLLGPSRAPLGTLLGPSWASLGRLSGGLGTLLGRSWGALGRSWAALGALLGRSWRSWVVSWCSWTLSGRSWDVLGDVLGCSWPSLGPFLWHPFRARSFGIPFVAPIPLVPLYAPSICLKIWSKICRHFCFRCVLVLSSSPARGGCAKHSEFG